MINYVYLFKIKYMNYLTYYHRNANILVEHDDKFNKDYSQLIKVISSISDSDLAREFNLRKEIRKDIKSLSEPINKLLKEKLGGLGWNPETSLFRTPPYNKSNRKRWRLDFAKNLISIEVAFNHQEATAHNIMKPVLASDLNHVKKDIKTELGIIIVATKELKKSGNFDGAIGTFESFKEYFQPYYNIISTPIVLIGLRSPESFKIDKVNKGIIYL